MQVLPFRSNTNILETAQTVPPNGFITTGRKIVRCAVRLECSEIDHRWLIKIITQNYSILVGSVPFLPLLFSNRGCSETIGKGTGPNEIR